MQMCSKESLTPSPHKKDWFVPVSGLLCLLVLIADYYLVNFNCLLWSPWMLPFEFFCLLMVLLAIGRTTQNEKVAVASLRKEDMVDRR